LTYDVSLAQMLGIMELLFPRTFAPRNESSVDGTFAPWNFLSMELLFPQST